MTSLVQSLVSSLQLCFASPSLPTCMFKFCKKSMIVSKITLPPRTAQQTHSCDAWGRLALLSKFKPKWLHPPKLQSKVNPGSLSRWANRVKHGTNYAKICKLTPALNINRYLVSKKGRYDNYRHPPKGRDVGEDADLVSIPY